jgi:hypothetical protein
MVRISLPSVTENIPPLNAWEIADDDFPEDKDNLIA